MRRNTLNWKLTLTKGAVVGVLAALGVWIGDAQGLQVAGSVSPWWIGIAVVVLETVRDAVKTNFGAFAPKE
jgi:hypothetical protein